MDEMKTYTDEQIVKALECCSKDDCESCPLSNYDGCKSLLFDGDIVIDLIKRQQAEIERFADIGKLYSEVRADVVREFAERIFDLFPNDKKHTTISRFTVKRIVKEMTEGGDAT